MVKIRQVLLVTILAGGVSACSTLGRVGVEKASAYAENQPDLRTDNVSSYVKQQNENIANLSLLVTGRDNWKPATKDGVEDWSPLVQAGVHYVDIRCERYLDALFWFNRVREASSRQINYTGAAAGAALTVLEASKQLIGLTPLAFTLGDQTVNNIGKGLLFDLEPTTVKLLVMKEQTAFKETVGKVTYTTRIAAIQTIQAYANICLPSSIETQATNAINRAEFKRVDVLVTERPPTNVTPTANEGTPTPSVNAAPVKTVNKSELPESSLTAATTVTTTTSTKSNDGSVIVSTVKRTTDGSIPPNNAVPVIEQVQGNSPLAPK